MLIATRYVTPIVQFLITIITAVSTLPVSISLTEYLQLGILFVQNVVTYFVPLVKGPWAAAAKTGSAIVLAVLSALIAWAATGTIFDRTAFSLILLAALNALAAEIGARARIAGQIIDARNTGIVTTLAKGDVVPDAIQAKVVDQSTAIASTAPFYEAGTGETPVVSSTSVTE